LLSNFSCPPVLLLGFNRPDNTQKVFESIRRAKPKLFFMAVDGPREEREDDIEKTQLVKKLIEQIDWPCEVKTLFRDKNLGCKLAVVSAINWFFESVESGIILEDDCVPSPDFFEFSYVMLQRYADDPKVMLISGTNFYADQQRFGMQAGAFFSKYFSIWGWATWRRAWSQYDVSLKSVGRKELAQELKKAFHSFWITFYYLQIYDEARHAKFAGWDYQWSFKILVSGGLCIVPASNLITNIGIDGFHYSASSPDLRFLNLGMQSYEAYLVAPVLKVEPAYHELLARDIFSDVSKLKLYIRALLSFFGLTGLIFKWRSRKKKK